MAEPTHEGTHNYRDRLVLLGIFIFFVVAGSICLQYWRIKNNEGYALGCLRQIVTAQHQCSSSAYVDQDSDGTGEFCLLGELAGTIEVRTCGSNCKRLNPTFINPSLGPQGEDPWSRANGYLFQVFLPCSPWPLTDKGQEAQIGLLFYDPRQRTLIDAQENNFRLYAWPKHSGISGVRCFAATRGDILTASNRQDQSVSAFRYSGEVRTPLFDAAVRKNEQDDNVSFAGNCKTGEGKDGQIWVATEDWR